VGIAGLVWFQIRNILKTNMAAIASWGICHWLIEEWLQQTEIQYFKASAVSFLLELTRQFDQSVREPSVQTTQMVPVS
jgi:uncharacterized membrane protein YcfT